MTGKERTTRKNSPKAKKTTSIRSPHGKANNNVASMMNDLEDLKKTVHTMANIIVKQNPHLTCSRSPSGVPLLVGKFNETTFKKSYEKLQGQEVKKQLFTDHYINFNAMSSSKHYGRTSGEVIPKWFPISFQPPPEMILDEVDAAIIGYVFTNNNDNEDEILIESTGGLGYWKNLKTLMPNSWVDQDVLNLLASKLTNENKEIAGTVRTWYLPTIFAYYILCDNDTFKPNKTPQKLRDYYQKEFMGFVEDVRKICVPINDNYNHWYLLIIDLFEQELILLDSLRDPNRREHRRRQVKRVAIVLEDMLSDNSFYEHKTSSKPILSDFQLIEPSELAQQRIGSGDCGIWVSKWMIESRLHENYHEIQVLQDTRFRIAIDLVLNPHNKLKEKVIQNAFKYWLDLERKRKNLFNI